MAPGRYCSISPLLFSLLIFANSLGTSFPDRPPPTRLFGQATMELEETMTAGKNFGPGAARMFANGKCYMIQIFDMSIQLERQALKNTSRSMAEA